jgi:hypothetical protein
VSLVNAETGEVVAYSLAEIIQSLGISKAGEIPL